MHRDLFLFLCFFITFTACIDDQAHVIKGDVSINCGSTGISVARGGREWMGDTHPIFTSSLQIKGTSTVSTVVHSSISDDPIPYRTARISHSAFSYSFLVNPGQKFIRLHFNPASYKRFQRLKDFFTVEAGPFILLSNFSASQTADALGLTSFTKEFCINTEDQPLNIIFSPANIQQSQDTYAFVNGIEIAPVPSGHSYFHEGGDVGAKVVGRSSQLFYIDNTTALELVHRVNIKRDSVSVVDDFRDMFGMWATDPKVKANEINNITWKVSVDVGFRYLVRLHLSELGLKMAETGAVIFKVLINEMIADTNIDIVKERDTNGIRNYRDYVVVMKGHKEGGRHDLLVSLQSYDEFMDGYGLFKGFEIFKLSNPDNNFACPNPSSPARDLPSSTVPTSLSIIGKQIAIATSVVTIFALINIIVHKLREIWEATRTEEENKPSARAERFCRRFSLAEIELATRNFSDLHVIGKGGFGRVYKGIIDNGRKTVAIKRLKAHSMQGAREFLAEIETLSELRHINLVSLIGYCNEQGEMIIVYEYVDRGTLADHLYKLARNGSSCSSLTWKQRLNICIGAGRGLDYLHTGHAVIHRDVKVSNILLDEKFTAKVSDFGLVKHENINNLQSHVSTKVKGTYGYLDPNYLGTGKLTRKSDTYSFGVVLLEVLCGRPALDPTVAMDEQILTKWAQDKISKGEVDLIVASSLREEVSPDSLKAFVEVVERCLDDDPKKRPTMAQVVLQLEFALDRQDSTISTVSNEKTSDAPRNDETNFSASAQTTMASKVDQTPTVSQKARTNYSMDITDSVYRQEDGSKAMMDKPPRPWTWNALRNRKAMMDKPLRPWTWKALRNRFKQNRKNEFSIADTGDERILGYNFLCQRYSYSEIKKITKSFNEKIGQGGYGFVYKGMLPNGSLVAVKLLTETNSDGEEFINEVSSIIRTSHVNIVGLLGYCWERNKRALIYEFMPNKSLDKFIEHCLLNWDILYKIAVGVARGLEYLHRGCNTMILHLDIKPQNILLDEDFCPKISDFGVAKLCKKKESIISLTGARGTMGYIAPEVFSRNFGRVSHKSDVYSYGMMVLEIAGAKNLVGFGSINSSEDYFPDKIYEHIIPRETRNVDAFVCEGEDEISKKMFLVGLWCIQTIPSDRPSMSKVMEMLHGNLKSIPVPPKPALSSPSPSE